MKSESQSFDLNAFWQSEGDEHKQTVEKTFATLQQPFSALLDACEKSIRAGGKIMFFGNGGSAADAQHIAAELSVKLYQERDPIAGLCLTLDPSAMTATGNDFGFEHIFSRQLHALGRPGDVAVGISTSGNSANVLNALAFARKMDIVPVGFSGRDGGKMKDACDHLLVVPANNTARIQEMHITLGHILCGALEKRLGLV
jgi:D-sedoheptulose 7-phosphate isomerase